MQSTEEDAFPTSASQIISHDFRQGPLMSNVHRANWQSLWLLTKHRAGGPAEVTASLAAGLSDDMKGESGQRINSWLEDLATPEVEIKINNDVYVPLSPQKLQKH